MTSRSGSEGGSVGRQHVLTDAAGFTGQMSGRDTPTTELESIVKISFIKEGLTFTGEDSPIATVLLSVLSFGVFTSPRAMASTHGQ
jgi:hypothetical protein